MNKLNELLKVLANAQDLSNDKFVLLSSDLKGKTAVLDQFNVSYEIQLEGVRIDLSNQAIWIYKTKSDAVTYLDGNYFDKPIFVLENQLIYQVEALNNSIFFRKYFLLA